jgi:hypothetical protein
VIFLNDEMRLTKREGGRGLPRVSSTFPALVFFLVCEIALNLFPSCSDSQYSASSVHYKFLTKWSDNIACMNLLVHFLNIHINLQDTYIFSLNLHWSCFYVGCKAVPL